jgi:hypothetical protein
MTKNSHGRDGFTAKCGGTGFALHPSGFFDENPVLDVSPARWRYELLRRMTSPSDSSSTPGADAAEALWFDPSDPARLVAKGFGWKDGLGAQVEARETLKESRGAPFRDPRLAVHDEILTQPDRIRAGAEAREHDAGISPNVFHF